MTASASPLRFALAFLALSALLLGGFEMLRGSAVERFVVETLMLKPAAALINVLTPTEHVQLIGRKLVATHGPTLNVTRGCEGIEMLLLLVAAVLAFPATARQRVQGLLWGSLLAYALSLTRLLLLHYTLVYRPALWEALHGLVLPLGPIVLLALYFLHWTAERSAVTQSHAA
jgi:exosortase family protein XrtM